MINPFRAAAFVGSLALDCVEAAMCSLSCDRTVHAMWEEAKRKSRVDAADALAEKEAEEDVAEPSAFDRYASLVTCQCGDSDGYLPFHFKGCPEWRPRPNSSAPGCPPTPVAESPQEVSTAPNPGVETPAGTPGVWKCPVCGCRLHYSYFVNVAPADLYNAATAIRGYANTFGPDLRQSWYEVAERFDDALDSLAEVKE